MSHSQQRRTRSERVATLRLPPNRVVRSLAELRRLDVLVRLISILAVVAVICVFAQVWVPPMAYREGDIFRRAIISRVEFEVPNEPATVEARNQARRTAPRVYRNDVQSLAQLQDELLNKLSLVSTTESLEELNRENESLWAQFRIQTTQGDGQQETEVDNENAAFDEFRSHISGTENWERFRSAITQIFDALSRTGLIENLPLDQANQSEVGVIPNGVTDREPILVAVQDVRLTDRLNWLERELESRTETAPIAASIALFLRDRLPQTTLSLDAELTASWQDRAAAAVQPVLDKYVDGQHIVEAEKPIDALELALLTHEHQAFLESNYLTVDRLVRGVSVVSLILAIVGLCWGYILARHRTKLASWRNFFLALGFALAATMVGYWLRGKNWQAEVVPLYIFGVSMTIAFGRHLSMWLSLAVATVLTLTAGMQMWEYFQLMGVTACAILTLNPIRSRLRLIGISSLCSCIGFVLAIVLGVVAGRTLDFSLLTSATLLALWTVGSGFLITGLLPILEWLFGVLTDLSLLELGNASHPLLQELVHRAPGTYNHSINVASLAEAAAEAIGVRSLLVRVGAYFHDIGKIFKPGYFIENQGESENRHDALVPAMSTLIIIAHIKDGADLARTHHLPRPIIDFIEQHHGTTLVRFFFERANEQHKQDPDSCEVDEKDFRYPGPKPQTKEAAVMMLADSVESASRTLVEPGAARIESLVREISLKRLMDGQFDESGINLTELRTVEDSLIKSLIAYYHGRVRYPDQQTA
ncbi:MAG: HDIG domain-containing protein [Pirellulales bacterium]|nr:HDIG domain-containing protein [Pirellulales bacterium]